MSSTPSPQPSPPEASSAPCPPSGVIHIEAIELSHFRAFEHLRIAPPVPVSEDRGQWIVLLGDNGMGKTTILRGITFALAKSLITHAILGQSTVPFRRHGADVARIAGTLRGRTFHVEIRAAADREVPRFRTDSTPDLDATLDRRWWAAFPLLFAYGGRRGSALGGADRQLDFAPLSEVITLFDESKGLVHAETWLKQLRLGAELNKGGHRELVFQAVLAALSELLPDVTGIDVRDDGVWFSGSGAAIGARIPLGALSDGYVTTAGWVIDLLARWLHRAERLGLPIGTDFTKTMEGLVLVDEIDLFLHPHWQLRVIEDLRRVFPRMSFVVTTHNPLTLMGAREGEVFVLRRPDPEGPIQLAQIDLPPGIRADQVLTGPWFDLASTLDADTLQKLDRHRELLRAGAPESDPERRTLEASLRERLGTFADTSLDRMALSVAAEVLEEMGKQYQDLSPEERSAMRSRLKERLKARQGGGAQGAAG